MGMLDSLANTASAGFEWATSKAAEGWSYVTKKAGDITTASVDKAVKSATDPLMEAVGLKPEVGPDGKPKPTWLDGFKNGAKKLFNFDGEIGSGGGVLLGIVAGIATLLSGGGGFMALIVAVLAMFVPKLISNAASLFGESSKSPNPTPGATPTVDGASPERKPDSPVVTQGPGQTQGQGQTQNPGTKPVTVAEPGLWDKAKDTYHALTERFFGATPSTRTAVLRFTDQLDLPARETQLSIQAGLGSTIMHIESKGETLKDGKPITSPKGAAGIMQLMPATAAELKVNPHDPAQAVDGALRHLARLTKKYNGDVVMVAAAYNWGEGNLDRKGLDNAPRETRNYIAQVQSLLPLYAKESAVIAAAKQAAGVTRYAGVTPSPSPAAAPSPLVVPAAVAPAPATTVAALSPEDAAHKAAAAAIGAKGAALLASMSDKPPIVVQQRDLPRGAANDVLARGNGSTV